MAVGLQYIKPCFQTGARDVRRRPGKDRPRVNRYKETSLIAVLYALSIREARASWKLEGEVMAYALSRAGMVLSGFF